ncbi:L,D-transpeptidase [Camelimonas abortus]|uniref:L,D-transpeptidase n=1 Tax=Camelimonas abortus TaxID=1017184 RepID=A0ABV7LI81_9HYPH
MIDRRRFLLAAPVVLAACAERPRPELAAPPPVDPYYASLYGPIDDGRFYIEALDMSVVDPRFLRREVAYDTREAPGTIVVDPTNHYLYLVREGGRAIRYGVGVGREGFRWNGVATVGRKAAWPTWTPPAAMLKRDPQARPWAKGMPGGPDNPLGARALYLYQGGRDTLYRIHGTNDPSTIGLSLSSGCIRLFNHDIIHLYNQTPVGTKVVVLKYAGPTLDGEIVDEAEPDGRRAAAAGAVLR